MLKVGSGGISDFFFFLFFCFMKILFFSEMRILPL